MATQFLKRGIALPAELPQFTTRQRGIVGEVLKMAPADGGAVLTIPFSSLKQQLTNRVMKSLEAGEPIRYAFLLYACTENGKADPKGKTFTYVACLDKVNEEKYLKSHPGNVIALRKAKAA